MGLFELFFKVLHTGSVIHRNSAIVLALVVFSFFTRAATFAQRHLTIPQGEARAALVASASHFVVGVTMGEDAVPRNSRVKRGPVSLAKIYIGETISQQPTWTTSQELTQLPLAQFSSYIFPAHSRPPSC